MTIINTIPESILTLSAIKMSWHGIASSSSTKDLHHQLLSSIHLPYVAISVFAIRTGVLAKMVSSPNLWRDSCAPFPTMLANDLNHSSIKVYLQGISSFFCPAVTSFSLFTVTLPLTNPLSSCASSLDHWPSIYDISFIHNDGCYATTVKFVWRSNKRFQIVVLKNCKLVEFNCYLYTLRNFS